MPPPTPPEPPSGPKPPSPPVEGIPLLPPTPAPPPACSPVAGLAPPPPPAAVPVWPAPEIPAVPARTRLSIGLRPHPPSRRAGISNMENSRFFIDIPVPRQPNSLPNYDLAAFFTRFSSPLGGGQRIARPLGNCPTIAQRPARLWPRSCAARLGKAHGFPRRLLFLRGPTVPSRWSGRAAERRSSRRLRPVDRR